MIQHVFKIFSVLLTACMLLSGSVQNGLAASPSPALKQALQLDRQKFFEESIPHWKKVLQSNPEKNIDVYAGIKLSHALAHSGQLNDAMEEAVKLAKRHPDDFHVQFNLGNMTSAIRKYPEAVKSYQKIVTSHPKEGLSYVGLGLSLFGDRKTDESVKTLRQVRKLFKKQKNISWYQNVRIMIGQIKSFAPYPPDFSDLWLTNTLKDVRDTYRDTLFREFEDNLGL